MPLALPFNFDILSRNGRISEVCHLPDDITIKVLNGSLTSYKLFGVTYGDGSHFLKISNVPAFTPGTTGRVVQVVIARGNQLRPQGAFPWRWNIIKEHENFGTAESQKKTRYSLWLFSIVRSLFASLCSCQKLKMLSGA